MGYKMSLGQWFLVSCLVFQTVASIDYDGIERDVERQCIDHCPSRQNRTDLGHYDYTCDYTCNLNECSKGCTLWKTALSNSCQHACKKLAGNSSADRLSHREILCSIGCNDAIGRYFNQIRHVIGKPPAPALLDNSLGPTSLKLEWRCPEISTARLTFRCQWRYEEIATTWQYCNASWNPESSYFLVQGLQPYTKYKFRVALNLGNDHGNSIYSETSVIIATFASGVPASPPVQLRAFPVDAHTVSVNWEPGPFPHGPLLSYVLQITDSSNSSSGGFVARSEVKDVPPTKTFYDYRNLQPNTNYTVSVQMRNSFGSGPASSVQVSTPKEQQIAQNQKPILILGTQYGIFQLENLLGDSLHLFHSDETPIEGVGIHISKQLLFVSDANGSVWRIPIEQETKNKTRILAPEHLDFYPLDISVDWLNDQLYILGEVKPRIYPGKYLIKKCNLDGSGLTVAIAGLIKKPTAVEIDPCNGYLFWNIRDWTNGGIFSLDISDISNGVKHDVKAKHILTQSNLGAFIVDYINFKLFVSNQTNSTILDVSLDGKDIKDIRRNVVQSKLQSVLSLATINKIFYWTDGSNVYNEEHFAPSNLYYHNKISLSSLGKTSFKKILINSNGTQPWPIPLNPPTNLQAIFGKTVAKAKWLPPHLLGLQGRGAWQNWSYEISVQDLSTNTINTYTTSAPSLSITNLTENTRYLLKVLAYTKSGKGPWSTEFKGSTLDKTRNPIIIWSGTEGLFKTDAAIENIQTLLHKTRMRNVGFIGMTWYQDQVYMVTNSSNVYWYNLTSNKHGRLVDIDSVGSIAVDWIGKKLYWSNLKQQLIIRSNLNGSQQEPLPILTLAKELRIDSIKGYLYWSREYDVECAHLNGDDKMDYDRLEPFSGKQVMGLTLDLDGHHVYWIVRGSDGSHLFRALMMGYGDSRGIFKTRVALLQRPDTQGPLSYFNNRLLWLQDERNAVISDLDGKHMATVSGKSIWGLNLVYVVDKTLHSWPGNMTDKQETINIVPEKINRESVKAIGSSESFNITWDPVKNVNYGTVFYEIQLDGLPANNASIITTEPTIKYWREVTPFTPLNVTVRAFTYWASSPQIRTVIFSPPSTPSAPRNLRTYVTYEHNNSLKGVNNFSITFRWDPPLFPNGILHGYNVRCWNMVNQTENVLCNDLKRTAKQTEFVLKNLNESHVYYFQVQAFTEIGTGTMSPPIPVDSEKESPIPTLLIASSDTIYVDDIDANQNHPLVNGINAPLEIAYLMRENKLFWINELQELLMYHLNSANKTKIVDLKGKPGGLALDWLERSIYYVEEIVNETLIYKIDINRMDKGEVRNVMVYATPNNISKIEISPFTRKMYWIESDRVGNKVMYANLDGSDVEEFFASERRRRHINLDTDRDTNDIECNCPEDLQIGSTFTIDHSTIKKPSLIFIDSDTKELFATDKTGCLCTVIANNSFISESFPLQKIRSDFGSIYWTNFEGELYAFKKSDSNLLSRPVKATDVHIYGNHMQPYPPKDCLSPKQFSNFTPTIKRKSYESLTLKMPKIEFDSGCTNTSTPTVIYTIKYNELLHPEGSSSYLSTFNETVELLDLKPFTEYAVTAAASNHFTRPEEVVFWKPLITRTLPGAPSKPRNVSASVLHPTLARVNWIPPEQLNGEVIHYEIHWLTKGSLTGVTQRGEQPVNELKYLENSTTILTALLQLSPNEVYAIWIRACSESKEVWSDSDRVQITTYPEPESFKLVNRTSQILNLTWETAPHIRKYLVEYAPITSTNGWLLATNGTLMKYDEELVNIVVANLSPKTQYKFKLSLLYEQYPEWYVCPSDARFTFETLADRPNPPGTPGIQFFGSNMYKVVWEAPRDNGAPITLYSLESMATKTYRDKRSTGETHNSNNRSAWFYTAPSVEIETFKWDQVYNGTENSWIITNLSDQYKYSFRALALNSYGWSDPSAESAQFDYLEAERMSQKNPMNLIFIATFLPISICIIIVICFSYVTYSRRCSKQKKIEHVVAIPRGPDVELATLRELPRRGVHSTNILYVSAAPNGEDITMLPHIRRDQITLTKFLGSGAFGEVFEGKAKGLNSGAFETKVAVKTLKKGASDQEKLEFLQEAQLMSHFKHEHILQLLGVCLDNDPHFIIMELMEGGDLLTYLRDSRGGLHNTPSLVLNDLLKMCLDVSKGCKYLEEMHFVHRDLACRNCLVSSVESEHRIVKIGDFGLARDIYKNDYYRKEGEGLLPVRWMAPESLLDGVFTCQSDAWAFGVLLWEIMTLGQQPYQARSNLEVLHYVRAGGRLGKPTDCPDNLYKLMLKCWALEPEQRPTFKYCLEVLDHEHREHLRNPVTAAHSQYISTVPDRVSWKGETDDDPNKERTPFLANKPQEIPKYLELLYEPENEIAVENDGYEVPNSMVDQEEGALTQADAPQPIESE
ncbi:proto-oncogene tyrosine-protein kinase ROS isoform X2 [Anthonomus grandis grandis]|uniref:proto-oncogene tyrosine-protein kinase ROS isoform X2 n=1 Tax=Anthonomus grandis grandis TaxID=2921223 RepID=UPI002165134F|nr:proto-oncogene tyrosine-protein kinase ROS isoform X2 [Anthonomus grandis grandis]